MGNVVATDMADDDEVISKGLLNVRDGILNGNWDAVCEGYNSISGENLEPFQYAKSRLEKIRDNMKLGEDKEVGGLPVVPKIKKSQKKTPETPKEEGVAILTKEEGKMKVITNEFDQEEADFNKKMDSKSMKLPSPPRKHITQKLDNQDGDFRFRNKNRPPTGD